MCMYIHGCVLCRYVMLCLCNVYLCSSAMMCYYCMSIFVIFKIIELFKSEQTYTIYLKIILFFCLSCYIIVCLVSGICLGLQVAAIEFARNVLNLKGQCVHCLIVSCDQWSCDIQVLIPPSSMPGPSIRLS